MDKSIIKGKHAKEFCCHSQKHQIC